MFSAKSSLYATTLLTAAFALCPGSGRAGTGSITYDMQHIAQFGVGDLVTPEHITVGPDNNIYVGNAGANEITIYNKSGVKIGAFGTGGVNNGEFSYSMSIAYKAGTNIYVADYFNHRVQILDPVTKNYIGMLGTAGNSNGEFSAPTFVTIDAAGKIYVADSGNSRVQIFDQSGGYIDQINGTANSVTFDSQGNVYVVGVYSVTKYNSSYAFDSTFLAPGTLSGSFGIHIDNRDNVYITDYSSGRLLIYNSAGTLLVDYDNSASSVGAFSGVEGVYADTDGRIYMTEYDGYRAQILQLTSTETFSSSPLSNTNEIAATPLSNLELTGTGSFDHDFIGYNTIDINATDWTLSGTSNFTGNFNLVGGNFTNDGVLTAYAYNVGGGTVFTNNGILNGRVNNYETIINNGTINGTIYNQGIFAGSGTIDGGFNNARIVDPGSVTSTITVTGAYNDAGAPTTNTYVNAAGQSSLMAIGGAAQIAGDLNIHATAGSYAYQTSYTILTAAGGYTGMYNTPVINLAFLTANMDYSDPYQITLILTNANASLNFVPYAKNANQQSVASALSDFSATQFNGDVATLNEVLGFNTSEVSQLLSEVTPDEVAATPQIQRSIVQTMQSPLFSRLAQVSSYSDEPSFALFSYVPNSKYKPDQVWLETLGAIANQDGSANANGYRLGVTGFRGGVDKEISANTIFGLSAAYANANASFKNSNDKTATQYMHADLYAHHRMDDRNLIIEGILGAGGGRVDTKRSINAGGLGLLAEGNTNAYDISAAVKASTPIALTPTSRLIPNMTVNASWLRQNGFSETGAAPFNISMGRMTSTPVTVTPMVNWQKTYTNDTYNVTPDLGIGTSWQLMDRDSTLNANFASGTGVQGFEIRGIKQRAISLNISGAVTMTPFTDKSYIPSLTAQTTIQTNSDLMAATASLTAKWNW
jgi:uncharacterized protein with beta-barrel porin domain